MELELIGRSRDMADKTVSIMVQRANEFVDMQKKAALADELAKALTENAESKVKLILERIREVA